MSEPLSIERKLADRLDRRIRTIRDCLDRLSDMLEVESLPVDLDYAKKNLDYIAESVEMARSLVRDHHAAYRLRDGG